MIGAVRQQVAIVADVERIRITDDNKMIIT
jgi:hypothetical protein